MKEKWTKMPKALQRQALSRFAGGGLFLLLLLLIMESYRDLYLLLPCILCMFWLLGSALWLFLQAAEGNYMRLQGQCVRIDRAGFRGDSESSGQIPNKQAVRGGHGCCLCGRKHARI